MKEGTPMLRGDCNQDQKVDLSDAVASLNFQFLGGAVKCRKACDVNDEGEVDISDPIGLLNFLFLGGARPPDPFPACGLDATQDGLACEESACPR